MGYTINNMIENLNVSRKKDCLNWMKIVQYINNQGCAEISKTTTHFLIIHQTILVKCLGASSNYLHFVNKEHSV
jgi:hypothetical protein